MPRSPAPVNATNPVGVAGRVGDASSRVERPRRAPARRSHRRIDDHRHALGQPALHSNHLARASALYGAIGITVVTLGWFFILGRAMVLAITLNAVIYERFGTISRAVLALPVLRALPQKSPWIRRFFDLDTDLGDANH
jgi:hypothetical protein